MVLYKMNQKVFIRAFFSGGLCVVVERQYHLKFSVSVAPSRDTV